MIDPLSSHPEVLALMRPQARLTKSYDVKAIRNQVNLSQVKFAKLLGVATKSVRAWENGDHGLSRRTRKQLDQLLSGKPINRRYEARAYKIKRTNKQVANRAINAFLRARGELPSTDSQKGLGVQIGKTETPSPFPPQEISTIVNEIATIRSEIADIRSLLLQVVNKDHLFSNGMQPTLTLTTDADTGDESRGDAVSSESAVRP